MLNAKNLGLAGGILWGVALFIMTLAGTYTGYGMSFLNILVDVYPGFGVSLLGSFIGLAYGFVDGFIGLYLLAWLYNLLNK